MRGLFDLNFLIAMVDAQHLHHDLAQNWWAANRAAGWASCPLTQNGFIRVLSQPSYLNPIPLTEAIDVLRDAQGENHEFWSGDISLLDAKLFDHDRILGPKQLTDIYLLGLAVKNGGRLVTFDRAIPVKAVRQAAPHHLVVV